MIGTNLIGHSHLTKIVIKSNRGTSKFLFCQQIKLTYVYWNLRLQSFNDHKHLLMMNQINIIGDGSKCYSSGPVGLHISVVINKTESLTINLTKSLFTNLRHTALTIISRDRNHNKVYVQNCTFKNNHMVSHEAFDFTLRPLIDIVSDNSISFKHCNFIGNHHSDLMTSIYISTSNSEIYGSLCNNPVTNISFVACQFSNNVVNELLKVATKYCRVNLLIAGPSYYTKTIKGDNYINTENKMTVISIYNMAVNVIGPVIISLNYAKRVTLFDNCNVSFYNTITYKSNNCGELIRISKQQLYKNNGIC